MKLNINDFWVKLIFFSVGAVILWLMYILFPLIGTDLPTPKITINDVTPCLIKDGKRFSVKNLEEGSKQFICGDLTTDTSSVRLTLLIYSSDNFMKPVYVEASHLQQGEINFSIDPPLSSGKYRALVTWGRKAFADIYFDVKEK